MNQSIHEFLKSIRIEQQLSIQELSKISGVSASHISRIERCSRNPSPHTLEKLAPHLNVSYMTLLQVANLVHKTSSDAIHLEELFENSTIYFQGEVVSSHLIDQMKTLLQQIKKG